MTDEETRELDAQVAEKVMGWRREPSSIEGIPWHPWHTPDGELWLKPVPAYSSDGTSMLAVIARMRELGFVRGGADWFGGGRAYRAWFRAANYWQYTGDGDTLQEAVCRAALAAVEAQS